MEFIKTNIEGLYHINRPLIKDDRGIFTRLFAQDELNNAGIKGKAIHINSSANKLKGTLRGIHFQFPPFSEIKIVSCISGSVWDVGVDLRPNSKTRFKWFGQKLTPENGKSLLIPEGFGHGFITLEENSTLVYVVSAEYKPEYESGARFDDPLLQIKWPINPLVVSEKDKNWINIENRIDELDHKFL